MDTESTPPRGDEPDPGPERTTPPEDDPRVPRLEDGDPDTSQERGGAAPAVG